MNSEIKSIIRKLVERVQSEHYYVVLMRLITYCIRTNLKIELIEDLVVLNGYYYIPSTRRLPFYIHGLGYRSEKLKSEYLLDLIQFNDGDVVVDCGANCGDFILALSLTKHIFHYIGFEPSDREYKCLTKNIANFQNMQIDIYKKALAEKTGLCSFFVNTEAADGSLIPIENSTCISIETISLDEVLSNFPSIKLLKLEAEGYEPEVLTGAIGVLRKIEYISVDVGFERGIEKTSTLPQVVNFLLSNGFIIVANGKNRLILLFLNSKQL